MTITLDIRPEVRAELARQAASQGVALEAVAAMLLEGAVHLPTPAASRPARWIWLSSRSLFGAY